MSSHQSLPRKHQPRKRFGQNFLHDPQVIARIIDVINPQVEDWLIEIGPGQGALTAPLLAALNQLTVIELDRDLADSLHQRVGTVTTDHLYVIQANALKVNYAEVHQQFVDRSLPEVSQSSDNSLKTDESNAEYPYKNKRLRIVGNLPYNISTPLLFELLNYHKVIQDMHFMLQKEVVERITAAPNSKIYGRLSVMMQYHCQTEYLLTVAKGAFVPPPKVTSAVFRLIPYQNKPVVAQDETVFAHVVRQAFNHRRKTLRAIFKPQLSTDDFASIDIDPQARPETLGVTEFVALANLVYSYSLP